MTSFTPFAPLGFAGLPQLAWRETYLSVCLRQKTHACDRKKKSNRLNVSRLKRRKNRR